MKTSKNTCVELKPGVWLLPSGQDLKTALPVGIIGSLHGNEACGLFAINELKKSFELGQLTLQREVVLIHGNPEATALNLRHTPSGTDLNRLFEYQFLKELPPKKWTIEHTRAAELAPILDSLGTMLDLHSATSPTPPFGVVSKNPESRVLARSLGLPFLCYGWESPALLGESTTMGPFSRRGLPSVAVECGQHEDPAAAPRALAVALRFLAATGCIQTPSDISPAEASIEMKVVGALKKPSQGFSFATPFTGMQDVEPKTLLGTDHNFELRLTHRSYLIMPNSDVETGKDMLYLAEPMDTF